MSTAATRSRYSLTGEDYDAIHARQGGKCGICGTAAPLVIDHDHEHDTRAVRGLLCHPCNVGLRSVDGGWREPTPQQRAYLDAAWHLEHRPGLPPLARLASVHDEGDCDANPIGVGEIARLVGLTTQRIQQLMQEPGFPEKWVVLQQGPIWRDTDIKAWAAANRKVTRGRPKKATS